MRICVIRPLAAIHANDLNMHISSGPTPNPCEQNTDSTTNVNVRNTISFRTGSTDRVDVLMSLRDLDWETQRDSTVLKTLSEIVPSLWLWPRTSATVRPLSKRPKTLAVAVMMSEGISIVLGRKRSFRL